MFGRRPDGVAIDGSMDPITRVANYIMTERIDAQVFAKQMIDAEVINRFIAEQRTQGHNLSHMAVIIAAYVRMVSQMPEANRFVVNKRIYARNELCVSFTTVKNRARDNFEETVLKVKFDPRDTVIEVGEKIDKAIEEYRNSESDEGSIVLSFARFLMRVPGLPSFAVGLLKLLDRYGLMPKSLIDISPFHTSMFLTNVASLKMSDVFHHIYNFGTTSQFFSIGKREQHLQLDWQGNEQQRSYFPMGITLDERPCAGAILAQAMREFMRNLNHPELMLAPPKNVVTEGNKN